MTASTQAISDAGVSIWLDDLSRTRIESGNLEELIKNDNVVGVTTNPSIFQKALSQVGPYDLRYLQAGRRGLRLRQWPCLHRSRSAPRTRDRRDREAG